MGKLITVSLPHDLPENWTDSQYVSPGGTEVGLTEKHGYNYLMKQVNNAHRAINELDGKALNAGDSFGLGSTQPTTLSQAGWYRIASFEGYMNTAANALLFLGHTFSNGGASSLLASVNLYTYAPSVVVLDHKFSAYLFFDKLRIINNADLNRCYLDVHYGRDFENIASAGLFTFNYRATSNQIMHNFTPITELASGDTVVIEHDLAAVPNGAVITTGSAVVPATLE